MTPDWVPQPLQGCASQPDPKLNELLVNAQVVSGNIAFGEVPAGWTIRLDGAGRRPMEITAEKPGRGVRWQLTGLGQHRIVIGASLRSVYVTGQHNRQNRLGLRGRATRLYLDRGPYTVEDVGESDTAVAFDVEFRGGQHSTSLGGNARIRRIAGEGTVTVETVRDTDVHLSGSLTVTKALNVVRGDVSGNLVCHGGIAGACDLRVGGKLHVQGNIVGHGTLAADVVDVKGSVRGPGEPLVLIATSGLTVDHTVQNATLIARDEKSTVTIGTANQGTLELDASELTETTVRPSTQQGRRLDQSQPLTECVVVAAGNAKIFPDLETSVAWVGHRLELGGDYTLPEDVQRLLGKVPDDVLPAIPEMVADELLALGNVKVPDNDEIAVGSTLSCQHLSGGSVRVNEKHGQIVVSDIDSSTITAARLGVVNGCSNAIIEVEELLNVGGDVSVDSLVTLGGSGVFGGHVAGELRWKPHAEAVCAIGSGASNVDVCPPEGPESYPDPVLRIAPGEIVESLALTGPLSIEVSQERKQDHNRIVDLVVMRNDAALTLPDLPVDLFEVQMLADGLIVQKGGTATLDVARAAEQWTLTLQPHDQMSVLSANSGNGDKQPEIRLKSGKLVVRDRFQSVDVDGFGDVDPTLDLQEPAYITCVSGRFRLHRLEHATVVGSQTYDLDVRSAVLTGVTAERESDGSEYPGLEGGELIGVDVTELRAPAIRALAHLHVFEPDAESLRSFAKQRMDGFAARDRSQRLKLLSDAIGGKALSGATRSAVLWASARAHHAAVDRRHHIERTGRLFHRLVGYGFAPSRAFATFTAWWVLATIALFLFDPNPCADRTDTTFMDGPYAWWQQALRVLLLPIGLLRLETGGAETFAPVGCNASLHAVFFTITGVLLVYLLLAVRNYLRTPKGT